jgi:hypothetical protein
VKKNDENIKTRKEEPKGAELNVPMYNDEEIALTAQKLGKGIKTHHPGLKSNLIPRTTMSVLQSKRKALFLIMPNSFGLLEPLMNF